MELLDPHLLEKYSRLMLVKDVGPRGFSKIRSLRVTVVGCGATGSHIVDYLARLGVGYIRVIDGDFVDISNIYRMSLVTEEDAAKALPKAVACAEHARKVNSDVKTEAIIDRLEGDNAIQLLDEVDIIFDGTDNFRTRLLINEVAVRKKIPWVYVGIEGWYANVMLIEPERSACLHCLIPKPPQREEANVCDIIGVFPSVVSIASSIAVTVAIRHILGHEDYAGRLYVIDAARMRVDYVDVKRRPDCPVCVYHKYTMLGSREERGEFKAKPICGTEAVEVKPPRKLNIDVETVAKTFHDNIVAYNPYLVKIRLEGLSVVLFSDGRAIVDGTTDTSKAIKLYRSIISMIKQQSLDSS